MEAAPNYLPRQHCEGRILFECQRCGLSSMQRIQEDGHVCTGNPPVLTRQQRAELALWETPANEHYTVGLVIVDGRPVALRTPTPQAAPGDRRYVVYQCPYQWCGQLDGCLEMAGRHQQHDHPLQPQDNSSADEPSAAEARGLPRCCICCTKVSDVVFFPCKHVATCGQCTRILQQQRQNPRCPICKLAIMGTKTVKFSCAVSA